MKRIYMLKWKRNIQCLPPLIPVFFIFFIISTNAFGMDNLELFDFYWENQQFEMAEDIIQYTVFDSTLQDSVALRKISLYQHTKQWNKAIDSAMDILISSQNDSLQTATIISFERLLTHFSPAPAIEKITKVINATKNSEIRHHFLLLLSTVYERNHLFEEAKDVYFTILQDSVQVDSTMIFLKIIRTDIYLQHFDDAIQRIEPLLSEIDSVYVEDAKFLHFIAHYSNKNTIKAKQILLDLYLHHPNHPHLSEILEALADIFMDENQYLLSWYYWNKLYEISSAYKKMGILKMMQEVKHSLISDSLAIEQFKFFEPVYERFYEEKE
jgi:tetratricopeptide (TPR) repeat protein